MKIHAFISFILLFIIHILTNTSRYSKYQMILPNFLYPMISFRHGDFLWPHPLFFFLALVVQPSHHIIIQAVYRLFHAPLAYCPRKTGDSLPDIWGIPVISHLLPVLSQRKHMFFENKSLCYLTQIYFSLCSKTISFLFFFYWKTRLK